jgi:hypothetical protein
MLDIRITSSPISLLMPRNKWQENARRVLWVLLGYITTPQRRVNLSRIAHFVSLASFAPPHSSSRSRLLLLLLLAPHIVQAHTSVYVCAQYNALTPRPLDECNNVYAPPQDQLCMGLTVTD